MPRLNPSFPSAVFFLYGRNPRTGKIHGPCGSGVLIGMTSSDIKPDLHFVRHVYAVTCKHVALAGGSIIRINTFGGKSRFIEFDPIEWQFISNGDDIASIDVTDFISHSNDDFYCIHSDLMATKEFIKDSGLVVGEDAFMLGLFSDLPGKNRNMVAARFGNISLLASEEEPIRQPNDNRRPSHLFDMRSRPGFSGSPVFCYRTPAADLRTATQRGRDKIFQARSREYWTEIGAHESRKADELLDNYDISDNTFLVLFGIHAGQYHDRVGVKKTIRPRAENVEIIVDGDELDIPNSMSVVVPSWEILNLLDLDMFQAQRREREMEDQKSQESHARPESARGATTSDAPTAPDNPSHREAFTALVSKASKTKPQAD